MAAVAARGCRALFWPWGFMTHVDQVEDSGLFFFVGISVSLSATFAGKSLCSLIPAQGRAPVWYFWVPGKRCPTRGFPGKRPLPGGSPRTRELPQIQGLFEDAETVSVRGALAGTKARRGTVGGHSGGEGLEATRGGRSRVGRGGLHGIRVSLLPGVAWAPLRLAPGVPGASHLGVPTGLPAHPGAASDPLLQSGKCLLSVHLGALSTRGGREGPTGVVLALL